MSGIGGWHCTACHVTLPEGAPLFSGYCPRSEDGDHVLYAQLGQGYPNGWDGGPCTCVPLRVRTVILDDATGQEQVVDVEPITLEQWSASYGSPLSTADTGSAPGTRYRVELLRGDSVRDSYETTAEEG